jgi:hypothetical protein
MSERKYTVSEISRMRRAIGEDVWIPGIVYEEDPRKIIESELRTYLIAGLSPDDLEDQLKARRKPKDTPNE